jgi:hypothetical protein
LVVAGALVVPATPAFAHAADAPDATAYRTTVTGITPAVPGLSVRTVEAGARLELTNRTGRAVEVLGYSGEPYLEIRPDGTYENVNSPATYLNQTLAGDSPVPATASPVVPPAWRRVSTSTTVRWHDQRIHWLGPGLPPAAAADPSRTHRLRDWTVPLRQEVTVFALRGTLDWVPPPVGWLWWAGAALLAPAVTAAAGRRPRLIAPVALVGGLSVLGYDVARTLDGSGFSLVLAIPAAVALLAVRRTAGPAVALAGALLAVFGGLSQLGVFGAAVLPAAGPAELSRAAVLIALGAGTGMLLTGLARLRAPAPAALPSSA